MGILEYFLRTIVKIAGCLLVTIGGAGGVSILLHRNNHMKKCRIILLLVFYAYLIVVIYLTLFSRTGPPNTTIELRVFRLFTHSVDLIFKFFKSCFCFIKEHIWLKLQRPDINIPYIEEGALNIILFMPFGYLFSLVATYKKQYSVFQIGCVGFLFSLFIEIMQLLTNTGAFDLDDLINNTIGTLLGVKLYIKYIKPKFPRYKDDLC